MKWPRSNETETDPAALRWRRVGGATLFVALLLLALLPWWRNHDHLRNFYDYSIIVAGAARIEAGERPYVDFTTPFQSAGFVLNLAAEKLFGGTYLGLTRGAAAMTVVCLAALAWLLGRRWSWSAALLMAGALVLATVTQHTIIWYNAVGTVCLAVVAWVSALAPVWRRATLGWHLLVAAALVLGGVNKLNYQLLAVAAASAWALRAGLNGAADWKRVGVTLAGLGAVGLVLPPALELAWTGASPELWWHNTVGLAAGNRAADLWAALTWQYYLRPQHNYYGGLVLPQVGLVGVALTVWTVGLALVRAWREKRGHDRWLPLPAGLLAIGGGIGLLSTNYEIAYVALAGWIVLLVALWWGFGLPARGAALWLGLIAPATVVGAVAWHSAWLGQRSQFGYSGASRADYRRAEEAGAEFAYLRGTRVPPELFESFRVLRGMRAVEMDPNETVFYGPGLEYLERVWPGTKLAGLPLSIHWRASAGPREAEALARALHTGPLSRVWVSLPQDRWQGMPAAVLQQRHESRLLGPVVVQYQRASGLARPVEFIRSFGGNADARRIDFSDFELFEGAGERLFYGVTSGIRVGHWRVPAHRLHGEVVVRRAPDTPLDVSATVYFAIYREEESGSLAVLWVSPVELPAGEMEARQSYAIEGAERPLRFEVDVPPEHAGQVRAGWPGPRITHVADDADQPAWLPATESTPPHLVAKEQVRAWFPSAEFPPETHLRGARITAEGLELEPGGQVWFRVKGQLREFRAEASSELPALGGTAALRAFWYKGGRLELYHDERIIHSGRKVDLHGWGGEPGGWMVVANDLERRGGILRIRFSQFRVE